jgi:hypothetical protein
MFTDGDIFITNVTTTYEDIPKYCNLVGAEFDQDYPANTIRLNITDDETFWIGATIGFKRNINPIGKLDDILTSILYIYIYPTICGCFPLFVIKKIVDIQFSAATRFWDNLHQVCSKLKDWKAK